MDVGGPSLQGVVAPWQVLLGYMLGKQVEKVRQHFSRASTSFPISTFLPSVPALTPLRDRVCP